MDKPFSQACANNQEIISQMLTSVLADKKRVLEIGSGTGQHGVFFAKKLPHLTWQMSDRRQNHGGIQRWMDDNPAPNLLAPIALDVLSDPWPTSNYDGIYSANTAHIMPWQAVQAMFTGIGERLLSGGVFCLYGPMKYAGILMAKSNQEFDQWLQQQAPHQGIREFSELDSLAKNVGLKFIQDKAMPANNRLIVWQKTA